MCLLNSFVCCSTIFFLSIIIWYWFVLGESIRFVLLKNRPFDSTAAFAWSMIIIFLNRNALIVTKKHAQLSALLIIIVQISPGSVTDTDTEYQGISKYRYRCRNWYSKYRKILNTKEKKYRKKTINWYYNCVITASPSLWLPTETDQIISSSTIRQFSNFTTKSVWLIR